MESLKIGEVAKLAGVNLQTIHYYERKGLLEKPPRTSSNYRMYAKDAVRVILFIKHAQKLGFSLKEIKELLSFKAAPRSKCTEVKRKAEIKLKAIEDKIFALQNMRKALSTLIDECLGSKPVTECPILEALSAQSEYVERG